MKIVEVLGNIGNYLIEAKKPGQWVIDVILDVVPVTKEIWFYGSRAIGKHKRTSDTDILVVVPNNIVGEDYIKVVRNLQKLSSQYEGYDIQPTHVNDNIHRIAQEEGKLLYKKSDLQEHDNKKLAWRIKLQRFKNLPSLNMPERENKIYLMPMDSSGLETYYSLTGKDYEKIKYMPTEVYEVNGDAMVGDMSVINAIFNAMEYQMNVKNPELKMQYQAKIDQLKKLYVNYRVPYSQYEPGMYKLPEILAEPHQLNKLNKRAFLDTTGQEEKVGAK